ncbi:MAG: hypothetical protein ACI9ZD_002661, partial [Paracoccaceae bacterium]
FAAKIGSVGCDPIRTCSGHRVPHAVATDKFRAQGVKFVLGQGAHADLLSENRGQWAGTGVLLSGFEWPGYVNFPANTAEVYTPDDGCEAIWTFERVAPDMIKGWDEITVGANRCYVGLNNASQRARPIHLAWSLAAGAVLPFAP